MKALWLSVAALLLAASTDTWDYLQRLRGRDPNLRANRAGEEMANL